MESATDIQFQIEPAGPCRKKVTVIVPPERVSEEFNKSFQNLSKNIPIAGFRRGKAPRKLVEKRFGKEVAAEVKQTLIDNAFEEALQKNDLAPISDPDFDALEIEAKPEEQFAFDFTITVKPEFDLPDLDGIEVEVAAAEPAKAEVDEALFALRRRKATLRPVANGGIDTNDIVSIKVRGHVGEQELFHTEDTSYEVGSRRLPEHGLITDGLDEALLKQKAGATVNAKAFVPPHEEGHPLAGQDLALEVEVLDFKRPDVPELDEELAKGFDFDGVDDMVQHVTQDVRRRNEQERDRAIEEQALDKLAEQCDFELPEELISREADEMARRAAYELQVAKASEEEIAKRVAEVRARRTEETAREMRTFFVMDKIVENERILVTETEVKEMVALLAAYNDRTPEQMYAHLREAGRLGSVRTQLREKKARARLRQKVKVKEVDAPKEKKAASAKKPPSSKKTGTTKKTAKKAAKKKEE
ncbi:MAG: trigger factor [Planctomycetota bacterium]